MSANGRLSAGCIAIDGRRDRNANGRLVDDTSANGRLSAGCSAVNGRPVDDTSSNGRLSAGCSAVDGTSTNRRRHQSFGNLHRFSIGWQNDNITPIVASGSFGSLKYGRWRTLNSVLHVLKAHRCHKRRFDRFLLPRLRLFLCFRVAPSEI